ncbi:MAG: hypothetical protein UV53_C0019G0014 [Candidatus Azambacteria bacterium GW2011_GWE1_42_9]|nr:MAG: hypothetical protein UU33_C0001G0509 [Candidatus Azambacteria bacterium GW2011_GWF1_41_10]KKS49542.1 MAG: hypothetical protein UV14_C0001G0288 [Candidatus Azambacteria bacterium GW2011_GWF2_42_22]KKS78947.1 MAG: hypothetical protein UV53_C0019G0014 [Candidatus Azambacteria bacterium GW2011_GWE1_42_9]KKT03653.1 MAG: hypothetical protein UV81_C0001G0249 [Candidatus Azambacteria bacterium GW2011_GWD1_43_18]KKT12807.1 MAG: hypothetical protein UV93_C0001G0108 [Candidatus Azambacteria bacter
MKIVNWILNTINNWRSYFIKLGDSEWVSNFEWFGWSLTAIFGGLVIFLIVKLKIVDKWYKTTTNFLSAKASQKRIIDKSWQKILARLKKSDDTNLRLALIEADSAFDDLLKQMRLPGESMADRLKYLDTAKISNIEEIWRAHKLRNQIVHSPEYPVARGEMEFAIRAYENALKELEFID